VKEAASINIVLVERQALYRDAMASLLNVDEFVITANVASILDLKPALRAEVDVAVVRIDPRAGGALRVLEDLPQLGDRVRALVLTTVQDTAVYARAIELGARGVLSCDEPGSVLRQAIRTIYRGELWIGRPCMSDVMGCLVKGRSARNLEEVKIESLTKREREIIAVVTEGLRNKQIAERLFISEATVRNHLTSILAKLGLGDRFDLTLYAFRQGLVAYPQPHMRRMLSSDGTPAPDRRSKASDDGPK
jgi:DNA-binding NarL/FixJ family response regulator